MAMKLTYRFREQWPAIIKFLFEFVGSSEPACIACLFLAGEDDGVDHAVAVEEVVAGGRW